MSAILVTGGTGFVGQALLNALVNRGHIIRATSRKPPRRSHTPGVQWVRCDLDNDADLMAAMKGIDAAYYLVHHMGQKLINYAETERVSARRFAACAAASGVKRVIYLGGLQPSGAASTHLQSRLDVGSILRGGAVPTVELRASMIVGAGSVSWQIVRDLAMRLPVMALPRWVQSRTSPLAIGDVVVALVRALQIPLSESVCYDLPGCEVLSGEEILRRTAALKGRILPAQMMTMGAPKLSSYWLKIITRADYHIARELVLGFASDLLPRNDDFWKLIHYRPQWTFDQAAAQALGDEMIAFNVRSISATVLEGLVQWVSPKISPESQSA